MMRRSAFAAFLCAAALAAVSPVRAQEMVATVNGSGIPKVEFDRNWDNFVRQRGLPPGHSGKAGGMDELRGQLLNILIAISRFAEHDLGLGAEGGKRRAQLVGDIV